MGSVVSALPSFFTRRRSASVQCVRAILNAPPVERFTSGWAGFGGGANPASCYKAVADGEFAEATYLRYVAGISDSLEDVVVFDETHIPKPKSRQGLFKVSERCLRRWAEIERDATVHD